MSDDDDDEFDSEKTQIFLPGGNKPKPAPKEYAGADPNAQSSLSGGEAPAKSDSTEVDFDITAGADFGSKPGVEPQTTPTTTQTTKPRSTRPVRPTPSSSGRPAWLVFFAMLAVIAYLIFR